MTRASATSEAERAPTFSRFMRIAEVCEMTGLPRSTIYEMIAEGKFPPQAHTSARAVAWIETEVIAWCLARVADRDTREVPGESRAPGGTSPRRNRVIVGQSPRAKERSAA